MTKTCRYRRDGKICKRRAVTTLIGYGVDSTSCRDVLTDMSIRSARSYCQSCAAIISGRCLSTTFISNEEVERIHGSTR